MATVSGDICAYLDESIPQLRGDHMHFTARSAGTELQVVMSRHEARRMAVSVLRQLDDADRLQASGLVEMRGAFAHADGGRGPH